MCSRRVAVSPNRVLRGKDWDVCNTIMDDQEKHDRNTCTLLVVRSESKAFCEFSFAMNDIRESPAPM